MPPNWELNERIAVVAFTDIGNRGRLGEPDAVFTVRHDIVEDDMPLLLVGPDGDVSAVGLSWEADRSSHTDDGVHDGDCQIEDTDNYLDVILVGDGQAARSVTHLEIPGRAGGYDDLHNPGGPGPEPFDDVRCNAPGPPELQPVVIAKDGPMQVDRCRVACGSGPVRCRPRP